MSLHQNISKWGYIDCIEWYNALSEVDKYKISSSQWYSVSWAIAQADYLDSYTPQWYLNDNI